MRILLIEDDEILAAVLRQCLLSQHYIVETAEDGQLGWDYAQESVYDLILLDVGLPKIDGITLCQQLRSHGCITPILLITAKEASGDRIRGLDAGADDYLIKPLDLQEFQARVRALLRRGDAPRTPVLEAGALRLDPRSCQVTFADTLLSLTPKEYSLLELFLRNPSRVFSRGNIIEHLWTFDDPPQEESVKSHIKGLRQKLKQVGAANWVENVYGIGYRFNPQIEPHPQETASTAPIPPTEPGQSMQEQFDQAMGGLWQQYQGLMAERITILQRAEAALQQGTLSSELRYDAERAAHKLAGVLGMFERDAGTEMARQLEMLLQGEATLNAAQQEQVRSLITSLASSLATAPTPTSALSPLAGPPARLLLIDPDVSLAMGLQDLARPAGLAWHSVRDLMEAYTWLGNHTPDLVVMNVDDTGHRDRAMALIEDLSTRTPGIPVLVLAAADALVDRVMVARAGGRGFLPPPITAAQVWQVVVQTLERSRAQTATVLVVDDDPIILAMLHPLLEPWGIRMAGLHDPLQFWQVLNATAPDLLILDVEMPDLSGVELCQAVRTDPQWQGLPILFLTAHQDLDTIQQVFAAGADDYVIKPVAGPELLTRIMNRLERSRLLRTFSTRDPLTGLANQPQSQRELEQMQKQAQNTHTGMTLVVLRVAQLTAIHRQYGHAIGHHVLHQWGRSLQLAFRGAEVVGYWGNGEFVVGIPGLTPQDMGDRLADLLASLRQQVFSDNAGHRFQVDYQMAIAHFPTHGQTIHTLYQFATAELASRSLL